jgi:hypothetical protein|tara:strand:- start:176 stop:532 length:357 start_codon:yes stop_codon:yes gene_type:complete
MKIDTIIDIAGTKRISDKDAMGKSKGTYRRLMYTLMTYKAVYKVESVEEMFAAGPAMTPGQVIYRFVWEREFLRLPNSGKKSLNLFKEILFELGLFDYYRDKYWDKSGPCPDKYWDGV